MGWGPNQLEEAKNLIRFIQQEKGSDRWVLVGDFNALPGSPVYRALCEAGCVDSFASFHDWDEDTLVKWPTAGFMNLRMHLDHVFSAQSLRWLHFEGTHRFGLKNGNFHSLSDHVPIVGTFTFG
jgi:endonuclease/exonuclease/phosphatase family metal-dependent hydrolase